MHKPDDKKSSYGVREYWPDALDAPGATQMKHLKNLILSKPFFERIPDQSIISGEQGEKYNYLIATRRKNYAMIYTYNGRNMKIKMGKIAGRKVKASWFNPRIAERNDLGRFKNTGIKEFDPPGEKQDGNDWVLLLEKM